MTAQDLIDQCDEQIALMGSSAQIGLIMPGKWGKRHTRRLSKGGPVGHIVSDNFNGPGILVLFNAKQVKQFLLTKRR